MKQIIRKVLHFHLEKTLKNRSIWVAYLLEETEQNISVDGSLVSFVQHDYGVLAQLGVDQTLPQQHTVCHVLDYRLRACAVLESDGVTHLQEANRTSRY